MLGDGKAFTVRNVNPYDFAAFEGDLEGAQPLLLPWFSPFRSSAIALFHHETPDDRRPDP